VLLGLLAAGAGVAFVLSVLPEIAGFGTTMTRVERGTKLWLLLGVGLEALSRAGYIALLRMVFAGDGAHLGWRASYQITRAGVVATKLFAAAGAGGVAVTAWALSSLGLGARAVARRMAAFEILLYAVYMGSLVVCGVGLRAGLLPGTAPLATTLAPAAFGAAVIAVVLAFRFVPDDIERRVGDLAENSRRGRWVLERIATVPRTVRDGVVTALALVRAGPRTRGRAGLLGLRHRRAVGIVPRLRRGASGRRGRVGVPDRAACERDPPPGWVASGRSSAG
jgi:hypothetical protein